MTNQHWSARLVYLALAVAALMVAAGAFPILLALAGWLSGRPQYVEYATKFAPLVGSFITVLSVVVAAYVAYNAWLLPFRPVYQTRPFLWRLGPGTVNQFNVLIYLSIFNEGATSGAVSDLLIEIDMPKGQWILEPYFTVKPTEFYQDVHRPEVNVPLPRELIEGPFTPIYLPARTQTTKAVLFGPALGQGEFDLSMIATGQHALRLYARHNLKRELEQVVDAKIVFEDDVLAGWKANKTVAGEVRHRDTNIKELPRKTTP